MDEFSIAVLCLAGSVFAASATAKFSSRRAYRAFRDGLAGTTLVPGRLLPATAAALSGTETLAAAGLLGAAGMTMAAAPGAAGLAESALGVAVTLAAVLTAGVAAAIRRDVRARCACFGARASRPLGRAHLARNACLLAVVAAGLAGVPVTHGRPALAGGVLAAVSGMVAASVFVGWEELAALFAPVPPAQGRLSGQGRR